MTPVEWLGIGVEHGFCGPVVCATHDGVPTSEDEDERDEPCLPVVRVYHSRAEREAVEATMSSVDEYRLDSPVVAFDVLGVPAPQGSKSAVYAGGRARVIEGSSTAGRARHKAWRLAVADTAREVWAGRPPLDEPVAVHATFWMPRPQSARKGKRWADRRPDLDKLCRSLLDSLSDAGVLADDSRVTKLVASKALSTGWTGATVVVYRAR